MAETIQIHLNGERREVAEGVTVARLVADRGLAPEQVAVEVNRAIVPRAEHADRALAPGDRVEIVTLVGGG